MAGLLGLLSHIMASWTIERRPQEHPSTTTTLKQLCDFHVPAGPSLASQVPEGSGKARWSGSAPGGSKQPCEMWVQGVPEGLRTDSSAAPRAQGWICPTEGAPASDSHKGMMWVSNSPAGQTAAIRFLSSRSVNWFTSYKRQQYYVEMRIRKACDWTQNWKVGGMPPLLNPQSVPALPQLLSPKK